MGPSQRPRTLIDPTARDRRRTRILVADDTKHVARLISHHLEPLGYSTEVVHTGRDAILAAESFLPDAALVDWCLPEPSGAELIELLRALSTFGKKPIVVITGSVFDRSQLDGTGIDSVVLKPFSLATILQSLRSVGIGPRMRGRDFDSGGSPLGS